LQRPVDSADSQVGVGFLRGGTRPPTSLMVDYIDQHRQVFGVESICNVLPIVPSTYHDHKTRQPCARALRDAEMKPVLADMFVANYSVYGARKLWHAARRAGHDIGRDQVARLMRDLDIRGATRRRRRVQTTRPDEGATRSPDLVDRKFAAESPNQLWVTDLTYVPTWSGVAYVTFVVDVYESPWFGWRFLILETRMESWEMRCHRGSRQRVGIQYRRRNARCVWSASYAQSWEPIMAR
jgi:putative transposase